MREGESMRGFTISALFCFGAWAACAAEQPEPPDPAESISVSAEPSAPLVTPATPAMLAAALSGDPEQMARSLPKLDAACHTPIQCPLEFASCSAWSAATSCGQPACSTSSTCRFFLDPDPKPRVINYPPLVSTSESFRVCFNQAAQSCVEFARHNSFRCDPNACCSACLEL
jgi:hypothetical protein